MRISARSRAGTIRGWRHRSADGRAVAIPQLGGRLGPVVAAAYQPAAVRRSSHLCRQGVAEITHGRTDNLTQPPETRAMDQCRRDTLMLQLRMLLPVDPRPSCTTPWGRDLASRERLTKL